MSSIVNKQDDRSLKTKVTIGEKIEATKSSIVEKLNYLNNLNAKLKNDYVPLVVINNLNQSIKDVEVSYFRFKWLKGIV